MAPKFMGAPGWPPYHERNAWGPPGGPWICFVGATGWAPYERTDGGFVGARCPPRIPAKAPSLYTRTSLLF